jgi:hypothetical protein
MCPIGQTALCTRRAREPVIESTSVYGPGEIRSADSVRISEHAALPLVRKSERLGLTRYSASRSRTVAPESDLCVQAEALHFVPKRRSTDTK